MMSKRRIRLYLYLFLGGVVLILGGTNHDHLRMVWNNYYYYQQGKFVSREITRLVSELEESGVRVVESEEVYQQLVNSLKTKRVIVGVPTGWSKKSRKAFLALYKGLREEYPSGIEYYLMNCGLNPQPAEVVSYVPLDRYTERLEVEGILTLSHPVEPWLVAFSRGQEKWREKRFYAQEEEDWRMRFSELQ